MTTPQTEAKLLFDKNHELFLNFNRHTDQTTNAILYLNNKLETLAKNLPLKSPFNYLDIGCGYGNRTLAIIEAIQKYQSIKTIALDPSATLLSMFKDQINNQNIDLICSTLEDFHPDNSFHFISSIHTFYYIDNWEAALQKMLAALDRNGSICIVIRANDDVCHFKNFYYKEIRQETKIERNSDELCKLLNRLKIKYKIDIVESRLDITDCLLQNENGNQLIEFLLRQPYESYSKFNNTIISYLKSTQSNGYLTQKDGYVWLTNQN